jgi:outer membrane receptor protein involved in Fe transport
MNTRDRLHELGRALSVGALALAVLSLSHAAAAALGKVQGKVVAADTGEPLGFADLLLIPADTTMRKVGGLSNADGTFLLQAPAGRYSLQIRALSYARKVIEGVQVEDLKVFTLETLLPAEAIVQEEVVVEARARHDTEEALLTARKKALTVGDAVAAEQLRRTPDKDAAEVLRRVTGISVSEGKYVFVRGLGERYSSTEVDGVRLVSPEQNKRVVPLDLFPAHLLDNVVIQKTYSADRPGEFGGGDVQVRTRAFPGNRSWSLTIGQGIAEGTTFGHMRTYRSPRADILGFGASFRGMPSFLGDRPLTSVPAADQARFARELKNIWSPNATRVLPNGSYTLTYGDELEVFGRSLGMVHSASLSRSFDEQQERQRFFPTSFDTTYDYEVQRSSEKIQLGGMSALSYRLSPSHTFHVRGVYTHNADDEVREYEGRDFNEVDDSGEIRRKRSTRLLYVERTVASGSLEGRHELRPFLGSSFDWRASLSRADRLQPDRREYLYKRFSYPTPEGGTGYYWQIASPSREFGSLAERGWGVDGNWSLPYRLGRMGAGKLDLGMSLQRKQRDNAYRRFVFLGARGADGTAPPESLFQERHWTGEFGGAEIQDNTLEQDNYDAAQRLDAGYASLVLPMGSRLRGIFGLRYEHGFQDVRSFDLFARDRITAQGRLDDVDWLPSANLNWSVTDRTNLRLAASRTLSRPDLNELSPSPALEYSGGFRVAGNPNLERATIDNYDIRVELFPGAAEVLAAGVFYKRLHGPIEHVIRGESEGFLLVPENSESGQNVGFELEARIGLGRLWEPLGRFSLNSNYSRIQSEVKLRPSVSHTAGSTEHPLQGQASYLINASLTYAFPEGDATLLWSGIGKRLETLGLADRPDVYDLPITTLDAAVNWSPTQHLRLKVGAKNLTDMEVKRMQGPLEYSSYHEGRSYSLTLSYGS